jgi:hypothetical protein
MKAFGGYRSVRVYVINEFVKGVPIHTVMKALEDAGYPHKQAQNMCFKYRTDYFHMIKA